MKQPSAGAPNCKSPHLSAQLGREAQYSHSTARVCHILLLTESPAQNPGNNSHESMPKLLKMNRDAQHPESKANSDTKVCMLYSHIAIIAVEISDNIA